jgi:hypothetical protein
MFRDPEAMFRERKGVGGEGWGGGGVGGWGGGGVGELEI